MRRRFGASRTILSGYILNPVYGTHADLASTNNPGNQAVPEGHRPPCSTTLQPCSLMLSRLPRVQRPDRPRGLGLIYPASAGSGAGSTGPSDPRQAPHGSGRCRRRGSHQQAQRAGRTPLGAAMRLSATSRQKLAQVAARAVNYPRRDLLSVLD